MCLQSHIATLRPWFSSNTAMAHPDLLEAKSIFKTWSKGRDMKWVSEIRTIRPLFKVIAAHGLLLLGSLLCVGLLQCSLYEEHTNKTTTITSFTNNVVQAQGIWFDLHSWHASRCGMLNAGIFSKKLDFSLTMSYYYPQECCYQDTCISRRSLQAMSNPLRVAWDEHGNLTNKTCSVK